MGTILVYQFITKQYEYNWENMSICGKMFFIFMLAIFVVVVFTLALIENLLIVPCWLIYNVSHKKECRQGYVEFLGLDKM